MGSTFVEPCNVQNDDEIVAVFEKWKEQYGTLDILIHSLAFAGREALMGQFVNTTRDQFHLALDISAYSLVALTRAALPLLNPGASVLAMTYYASEKYVPNYNVMAVAKAALETCTRYLAVELGPKASASIASAPDQSARWPHPVWRVSGRCTTSSKISRRCAA